MGTIDGNHQRSWEEVCRRHAAHRRWHAVRRVVAEDRRGAGRRRYNAVRQLKARLRRSRVLQLLHELGWGYGTQAQIARVLQVSEAAISRDLKTILPLFTACPTCGALRPRDWWEEA